MNELTSIDPRIIVALGALAGVIVNSTRLHRLARFIPALALGLIVVEVFGALSIPAPLMYAAVGAGFVVSLIQLFGGK